MRRLNDQNECDGVLPEIDYDSLEFYEQLSAGTYGAVYRAKWNPGGKIVAVKRLLVLEKEAHILSLIRHRNIVQFYGAVTKPPNFCIITEFASKGSLFGYLHDHENADITFSKIVQWAFDIASGIHYLHFDAPVTIVHRDLKSKNVVIDSYDVCKLCDFGTSRALFQTTRMSYVGTLPWMSPEAIQSLPVSEATDTWSYGVILWELVTREIPFETFNEYRIAWMVVENGLRLTIPTSCPTRFANLMRWCWETDAKVRPNFKEILAILMEIREDDSTSNETETFLENKTEWRAEIEKEMHHLKEKESELNDKLAKLREWEQRLKKREQNWEFNRRREISSSHDVNLWTEGNVITWLLQLKLNGVSYDQLAELAIAFQNQQIIGERLLLLTETDLKNLGVTSPAFQWQLLREITKLDYHNKRLLNFPPLSSQNDASSSLSSKTIGRAETVERGQSQTPGFNAGQQQMIDLTLLFGVYIRLGAGLDSHKWKALMDVEDDNGFLADHPTITDIEQLIADVRFMVSTPPYMYKINRFPYVMPAWIIGLDGVARIQCVVNFTDSVRQPRNTTFSFDFDYENRGLLVEKRVQLALKNTPLSTRNVHAGSTDSTTPSPSSVSTANGGTQKNRQNSITSPTRFLHESQSSPALAPAWRGRSFQDAVPVLPPPPQPPKKSPLWSQIVTSLMKPQLPSVSFADDLAEEGPPIPVAVQKDQVKSGDRVASGGTEACSPGVSDSDSGMSNPSVSFDESELGRTSFESSQSVGTTPTMAAAPPRRGGRIRYRRKAATETSASISPDTTFSVKFGSSSSDSTNTLTFQRNGTPDNFTNQANREYTSATAEVERTNIPKDRKEDAPGSRSKNSVAVHGGYEKWKWKH